MVKKAQLAATVVAVVTFLLSGCAAVAGDGDVSGDWAVLPKAKVPVPDAGVCRQSVMPGKTFDWDEPLLDTPPIACTDKHVSETYYVGTITEAKTVALLAPPVDDEASIKPIYVNCLKRAADFLGGDYHNARVSIVPVLPTPLEWRGDARFYRCEMLEIADDGDQRLVERSRTLKDGLRGSRPAALQCANVVDSPNGNWANYVFISCAKPHLMEYTGVFTPKDGKYPGDRAASEAGSAGCLAITARYLNTTSAAMYGTGGFQWTHDGVSTWYWNVGDRGERCFIGPYPQKKFTGSVKGKPINTW